ncbi:MAG: type II toxin-antitoxin system VapB family antitoxin [Nocardioidaceae bacterium]|nr:type II toxin-antitoxin system VapB family antitoxin [Nocardioidaceae bacterium]MCL2612186.1 type II toxin-antitoxin system VapB family antitoxin [Nocardioidaceae bacterium]
MAVTSVDIDQELLGEAKAALHLTTTKDTVAQALREVVMRRRQSAALGGLAAIEFDLNPTKVEHDSAAAR